MLTYNNTTLQKLVNILEQSEYKVRFEKGNFNSGYAIVNEKNIIIINKFLQIDMKINTIIEIMENVNVRYDFLDSKHKHFYKSLIKNGIIVKNYLIKSEEE